MVVNAGPEERVTIRGKDDVVLARQVAREVTRSLGFGALYQSNSRPTRRNREPLMKSARRPLL